MTAQANARDEAGRWSLIATAWKADRHLELWALRPATEAAVVRFHDPRPDLERRAARWGYPLGGRDLADLARFAAALAYAEADAWDADEPHVATRAFEERRFLAGDRIIHWAVPWLDGLSGPDAAEPLLALGELLRAAPGEGTREGLAVPGEDAYGPLAPAAPLDEHLRSLWSGLVLSDDEAAGDRRQLADRYEKAAAAWRSLARVHAGTATFWYDLAARAASTSERLRIS